MPLDERLRHNLAAGIIWLAFLALYLGGAVLLMIGLVFACRQWWETIHQPADLSLIAGKTLELATLALGLFLVLIIPLLQRRGRGDKAWRRERRSGMKSGQRVAEPQ
jgi:hypothetical protein